MTYNPRLYWFYPNDYIIDEAAHQRELARIAALPIHSQILIGDGKKQTFRLHYESRGWCSIMWLDDGNHYEATLDPVDSQLLTITPILPLDQKFVIEYRYAK